MSNLKNFCQSLSKKALQSVGVGVATTAMALGAGAFAESASAVTIGGVEIDGYATSAREVVDGNFVGSFGDVIGSITDTSLDTYVYSIDNTGVIGFRFDGPIVNRSGFDLAFFDLEGLMTEFIVGTNSSNLTSYGVRNTGEQNDAGRDIYVAEVDISDFIAPGGGSIDTIFVDFRTNNSPALALVAGIAQRSVPEPSAMFGLLATVGFLAYQRGLKFSKKS